jgi:hypothetical protein
MMPGCRLGDPVRSQHAQAIGSRGTVSQTTASGSMSNHHEQGYEQKRMVSPRVPISNQHAHAIEERGWPPGSRQRDCVMNLPRVLGAGAAGAGGRPRCPQRTRVVMSMPSPSREGDGLPNVGKGNRAEINVPRPPGVEEWSP